MEWPWHPTCSGAPPTCMFPSAVLAETSMRASSRHEQHQAAQFTARSLSLISSRKGGNLWTLQDSTSQRRPRAPPQWSDALFVGEHAADLSVNCRWPVPRGAPCSKRVNHRQLTPQPHRQGGASHEGSPLMPHCVPFPTIPSCGRAGRATRPSARTPATSLQPASLQRGCNAVRIAAAASI